MPRDNLFLGEVRAVCAYNVDDQSFQVTYSYDINSTFRKSRPWLPTKLRPTSWALIRA